MRTWIRFRGGVIAVITLLAATAAVSQAGPARAATSTNYEVSFVGDNGDVLKYVMPDTGGLVAGVTSDLGFQAIAGTSPSIAANNYLFAHPGQPAPTTDQVAAAGPSAPSPVVWNMLYLDAWPLANEGDGAEGVVYNDTTLPMYPGTSPAETAYTRSLGGIWPTYLAAFEAGDMGGGNVNHLWLEANNPDTGQETGMDTGLVMAYGTSPAVATNLSDVANIVYQGANGHLSGAIPTAGISSTDYGIPMASFESPAVTVEYGDWTAAFQAAGDAQLGINSGDMVIDHLPQNSYEDSGRQMASGTDPAIAATSSVNGVAFADPSHQLTLWFDNGQQVVQTGQYLAPGTSPALLLDGGSWVMAYQQQTTNHLCFYTDGVGPTGCTTWQMKPGTSPSLALSTGAIPVNSLPTAARGEAGPG